VTVPKPTSTRSPRRALGVTARFLVVLVVLIPCLFAVALTGAHGLHQMGDTVHRLYGESVLTTEAVEDLDSRLNDALATTLSMLATDDSEQYRQLQVELLEKICPSVEATLANLSHTLLEEEHSEREALARMTDRWRQFYRLAASDRFIQTDEHQRSVVAGEAREILARAVALGRGIAHEEAEQARAASELALHRRDQSLVVMGAALIVALVLGVGVVIWLIRSVLTRTLAYSRFAARVAEGDDAPMEEPSGEDEIGQLGRVLQEMAARGRARRAYERTQFEFTETMQVTRDEAEAHGLLKRHLERTIEASEVTVLNRNNSADRLEAVTPLQSGASLRTGLDGAKPRSCLAVRQARTRQQTAGSPQLVACDVCKVCPNQTTCTPLLVGGEVIGSVLVSHERPLSDEESKRIHESVVQAAPVLANLRNLAIAEMRAATDALTGLPNKRAFADNLKQHVAQADRAHTSLAMLMLDLDHFKQVNDQLGHGRGDEVLASVGAALRATLRDSDFAARYGGEEFVVLLPGVDEEGARTVGEKIQSAFADIHLAELDRVVTTSIGVAMFGGHAGDPAALVRAADRALYTAKRNGRNRIETAEVPGPMGGGSEAVITHIDSKRPLSGVG
jgi:diguanylate cyclase (GGDEF)-like protein